MKFNKSYILGCLAVGALVFTSCGNDADYDTLNNQAYIEQTETNANTSKKIVLGIDPISVNLSVRVSDRVQKDCGFKLIADTAALSRYNAKNMTSFKMLPASGFTLDKTDVTIKTGMSRSESFGLKILPLTNELKATGAKYALAFRLESTDNNVNILQPGSEIVYILDQVVYQDVPVFNRFNNGEFHLTEDQALTEWTLEFCVNIDRLGEGVGELNNQQLFGGWAADGKDGEIYTRFGDAPLEGNRLQIKTQGTQMNSNMKFAENQWYHLAFVCSGTRLSLYVDGQLDNAMDLPGKVVNIGKDKCTFGNQDYLKANVMVSELRMWKRPLSPIEIVNNMYALDPSTDGIYAYFKLNEGSGNDFIDATGNGNTFHAKGDTQWVRNQRIDGKK